MVEAESFSDYEILIGVFEGDCGRGGKSPFVRGHVERGVETVAHSLVVSPERKWVAEFLRGGGVDEIEQAVLRVIVKLLEDPGFDLGAAVGEGDFVEIVLDDDFSFRGGLLSDGVGRDGGRSRWRWGDRRSGGGLRGHRLTLRAAAGRCGLREEFFQQRLEDNQDHERQNKNEEETALGAGFLLRIFVFGQMFTLSTSGAKAPI